MDLQDSTQKRNSVIIVKQQTELGTTTLPMVGRPEMHNGKINKSMKNGGTAQRIEDSTLLRPRACKLSLVYWITHERERVKRPATVLVAFTEALRNAA
ncbi:hypothetical protein GOBAR_DD19143 [Gossypium barbadense]|nr:hypothetical protein GOBAR_DD19143 [Gossypium barbadense]